MKKNLKKALSAVIALAVAVSMIPASFAAKLTLTDVADTASYATAVKTLVALDIINGYEDNSFKPDDLITRAETTKVVVAALNKIPAAEGMKGDTGFSDIQAKHEWATGYINAGVLEGFINGMENNTFGPDLNVTYAQIVTMLVRALGYEDYAKYMGGWPNGYLAIGNSEGITKGVSAATNANVTRAQVAMLVYNALNTPVVLTTGMSYDSTSGGFVPTITKYDGTSGRNYKSLLTEKFEGYAVEGYIVNNHNSKDALDEDQVDFRQAYGENYVKDQFTWNRARATSSAVNPTTGTKNEIAVRVGFTDAANYNGAYVKAIIKENDNREWEFISVEPEKNVEVTVEAKNINTAGLDGTPGNYLLTTTTGTPPVTNGVTYLQYFASSSSSNSTRYNLATTSGVVDVDVFVNGNRVNNATYTSVMAIQDYVLNNDIGTVKLVDTFQADGYYDTIYVDAYATAKISSINASTGKISLANTILPAGVATSGASASITLSKDTNTKLSYHIYYNGEEITVNDLKIDDIISIAYDTTATTLADSGFYNIYVSRDTTTGTLTTKIAEDKTLVFGETEYSLVGQYDGNLYNVGTEYTLYIDAFGRIFDYEESVTVDRYAIVDRFKAGNDDVYRVYFYTAEGAQKNYAIDYNIAKITVGSTVTNLNSSSYANLNAKKTAGNNAIGAAVYSNWNAGTQSGTTTYSVDNRVVKYKINTVSNKLTEIAFLSSIRYTNAPAAAADKTFNGRINALDTIKMDAATKIVDAEDYASTGEITDLAMMTLDGFADEKNYTAYAFGDRINNSTIDPFVIVTKKATAYDENARFAVVAGAPGNSKDEDDNDVYTVPVYYKGESDKQNLIFTQDVPSTDIFGSNGSGGLKTGEVIVFNTNSKGQVKKFYKISSLPANGTDTYNSTALLNAAGVNLTDMQAAESSGGLGSYAWSGNVSNINNKRVTVLYGPIINRNSKSITLGIPVNTNAVTYTTTAAIPAASVTDDLTYVSGPMAGYSEGDNIPAGTPIPAGVTITNTKTYTTTTAGSLTTLATLANPNSSFTVAFTDPVTGTNYAAGVTVPAGAVIPAGIAIPAGADITVVTYPLTSADQNRTAQYVNIGLTSNTNAYMYDYAVAKNRVSVISAASIPFNTFDRKYVSGNTIYWGTPLGTSENSNNERTNFAFVTVSEGVAIDVLVLAAK